MLLFENDQRKIELVLAELLWVRRTSLSGLALELLELIGLFLFSETKTVF